MSVNGIWTGEDDECLIDFVRNHEALYNVKSKDYRKTQMKQNLWNNIGTILEKSGSDCSKRWAYVRDYYIRRKGRPGSGGEAAKKRSNQLSFLDSVPSSRRNTITNIVSEFTVNTRTDSEEEEEEDTDLITKVEETEDNTLQCDKDENKVDDWKDDFTRNKRKKKITHCEERLQLLKDTDQRQSISELDETDLFFHSMAKIVKKLPRYEQAQLRMQISSLVGSAELRTISNESSSPHQ